MRITSDGKVGIGTSSPNYLIHGGTVDATAYTSTSAALAVPANTISYIANTDTTTNNTGCFFAIGAAGTSSSSIWYTGVDGGTTAYSGSYVIGHRTGTTAYAERLRIDSSGRLLVGTSSVTVNSSIVALANSGSTTGHAIYYLSRGQTNPTANNTLGQVIFSDNVQSQAAVISGAADASWAANSYPGRLTFLTTADGAASPTERMRLTSAGLLGLGTSSPATQLDVFTSATEISRFVSTNASNTGEITLRSAGGAGNNTRGRIVGGYQAGGSNFGGYLAFNTTTTQNVNEERVRITTAGNVGIGTTSPADTLDILKDTASAAAAGLMLKTADANGSLLTLGVSTSLDSASIASLRTGTGTVRPLTFIVGTNSANERMRIDTSGRLLVGTSTSVSNLLQGALQIVGTSEDSYITATRYSSGVGGAPGIVLGRSKSATKGTNTIVASGDTLGVISFSGANGTSFDQAASIAALVDGTPGASGDMPGRLVFATTADGAASPIEAMRIDSAGRVGIGATSPQANGLEIARVAGGTENCELFITSGATSGQSIIGLGDSTNRYVNHIVADQSDNSIRFHTAASGLGAAERLRIDSSGRLLVGTSTNVNSADGFTPSIQVAGSGALAAASIARYSGDAFQPQLQLQKSRGAVGAQSVVSSGDTLGQVTFEGSDGTAFKLAASIGAAADGTPGTNDMPGRLVFSTTLDGAASPTEAFRITNDRVRCYNQADPAAVNTTATLTVANLKTGIITSTTAAAVTMTLPTGTDTEAGFSGIYTNMTFEWSVINTGATNAVTVQGGTGHTLVGSGTVAASNSGRFASRRTASNTFVTYRLSS
jgi:hypothetical protein